jgi:hypothetical protein
MREEDVINVKIKPRLYIDSKTGLECFGHFVIVTFIRNNKFLYACSAQPGISASTPQNEAYEKAAFLRRMNRHDTSH